MEWCVTAEASSLPGELWHRGGPSKLSRIRARAGGGGAVYQALHAGNCPQKGAAAQAVLSLQGSFEICRLRWSSGRCAAGSQQLTRIHSGACIWGHRAAFLIPRRGRESPVKKPGNSRIYSLWRRKNNGEKSHHHVEDQRWLYTWPASWRSPREVGGGLPSTFLSAPGPQP